MISDEKEKLIRLVTEEEKISQAKLKKITEKRFGDMVKAVVDIKKEIMAIGGDLHSDEEAFLLELESKQDNLWGINLYPDNSSEEFIEFDSIINIRPKQGNRSRDIEDEELKTKIISIVHNLIKDEDLSSTID